MRDIPSASTSGGFPKNLGTGVFFTTDTFEEILVRPRQVVPRTPFQKLGLRYGIFPARPRQVVSLKTQVRVRFSQPVLLKKFNTPLFILIHRSA